VLQGSPTPFVRPATGLKLFFITYSVMQIMRRFCEPRVTGLCQFSGKFVTVIARWRGLFNHGFHGTPISIRGHVHLLAFG